MTFLDYFRRRKAVAVPQPSAVTLNNPGWLQGWGNGGVPMFGNPVNEETAMTVAAVYRCVTLISGIIASLDLGIYTDDPDRGQVLVSNKTSRLLAVNPYPNRQMTSFVFKELMVQNILLQGNSFTVIRYDQAGRVAALEYVPPWCVRVVQKDQRNIYVVQWSDGRPQETVDQSTMLHVPGPGAGDGVIGMSRIRQNARNSIAMARSIEEVAGKAYDNAMQPKMVVKLPQGMAPDQIKKLQAFMDNEFTGKTNVGKTLFVDVGSEVDALSINVVDLALIDAMKASTIQICAFFGVPPILLGEKSETSLGSSIEQILIAFLRFSLNSDMERIEAELTSKLCTGNQYVLFDRDQLLAMDATAAAAVAAQEISCGISTVNEIRRRKHRPTVEGGDTPLTNSTNIPLVQAIQPRVAPPTPPGASNDPTPAV